MSLTQLDYFYTQEVECIRRNPKLVGSWGYLQDYLRDCILNTEGWTTEKGTHQNFHSNYSFGSSPRVVVATWVYARNRVAYIRTQMPKLECVRESPSKYKQSELETLEKAMPDDLQRLLMVKRFRKSKV